MMESLYIYNPFSSPSVRAWHMTNAFYIQLLVSILENRSSSGSKYTVARCHSRSLSTLIFWHLLSFSTVVTLGEAQSIIFVFYKWFLIFPSLAQWPTTTFPISRLPVFIIGVLAGLQSPDDPLPSARFLIFPSYQPRKSESDKDSEESQWAQKIDAIVCLILLGVISGWISVLYFPSNQFFNFYFQLLGVHLLLTIMLGLTKVNQQFILRLKNYPVSGWWAFSLLISMSSKLGSMVGEALLGALPHP